MTWKCATDRVLIKREARKEQTASGILIPDKAREGIVRGIVLAAGPDATNVQPGDVAIFDPKYAREIEKDTFSVDATGVLAMLRGDE